MHKQFRQPKFKPSVHQISAEDVFAKQKQLCGPSTSLRMLGAIAGDIIGSVYEQSPTKRIDFPLLQEASVFTDDTVLTVAIAESILTGKSYTAALKHWGRRYPGAGYGQNFYQWLMSRCSVPYDSWGNGSAMRVSPVGWAFDTLEETLKQATLPAKWPAV